IKILRRPKSPVATVKIGRTTPKPLAQREADYNAAREKIFGTSSTTSTSSAHTSAGSNSPTPSSRSKRSSPTQSPALASATKPEMEVKPIEFRGVPPSTRLVQKPSLAVRDNAIRQPRGPNATMSTPNTPSSQTSSSSSSSQASSPARGGGGSRGSRQEGSIGFRKPLRGAPRPPPPSASSS
ncbi:hypothetical protein BGZ51_003920, partial [Haplosporangium sp. Z 767]